MSSTAGELHASLENSLTRLSTHEFIEMMGHFCITTSKILSDYLDRSLDAILTNALEKFSAKDPHRSDPDSLRQFGESLRNFVTDAIKLRQLCVRMSMMVNDTGIVDYLTKLSDHPFCVAARSQIGCKTGAIGGKLTWCKKLFMRPTWPGDKLYRFFETLDENLRIQFRNFYMPSKTEMDVNAQVSQMMLDAILDPEFGKSELSNVQRVVKEIMDSLIEDFKKKCQHMPPHRPSIPPNA